MTEPEKGPIEKRLMLQPAHLLAFFILAILGQNLDLYTKHLAFERVPDHPPLPVVKGVLSFQKTENPGIIFGIGQNHPALFLAISIAAVPLIVAIFLTVKHPRWITTISLGLILAGTLGNMFDRVARGSVRDFIKFDFMNFPLFNLADSFICVGVCLLVIEILFFEPKKKAAPLPAAAPPAPPLSSETPNQAH